MLAKFRSAALAATFLAGLALPALAQQPPPPPAPDPNLRTMTVTGEGVIRARPDMAIVMLGVVNEADDAKLALAANNEAMTRILDALRTGGIESRDLQTSGFSIQPRYSQPPRDPQPTESWTPEITGYSVHNTITLRIRDLALVGEILDLVVTLGANTVSGPSFSVAEPEALENSAREAAVREAREKAELYARAAELRLGPITRLEEYAFAPPPPVIMQRMAAEAAAMDSSVPIEGGEITFQSQVTITWRLE